MASKILIIYAYYETSDAPRNLGFFCRHAITPYRDRHYAIVINGKCSVEDQIPSQENVAVLKRDNKGFDFGAWAHALRSYAVEEFDYFILLNASVTGPFLPLYQDASRWPELFIALLNERVKLAGTTINVYGGDPIVQSMLLVTDRAGMQLLSQNGLFDGNDQDATKEAVIVGREIRASKIILSAGFHVDCLAATHSKRALASLKRNTSGDIVYPGAYHQGHTFEPLDTCFFKTNRGCSPGALQRSIQLADYKRATAADRCFQEPRILRTLEILKGIPSAWKGHLEFAVWLTCRFLPRVVVDLGVDYGSSTYAWGASGLSQVVGIDWFQGDEQTGLRDNYSRVLSLGETLAREHRYENTVRIWKSSFEEAAANFNRQVDVLHFDGLHTYEAVTRDLKCWLPKLSSGGIVVMHDVRAFRDVEAAFRELPGSKTIFDHSCGLGVASTDERKIEIVEKEWKQKLYPHVGGLKHRDFDSIFIQA